MYNHATQARIAIWRQKIAQGTMTEEEYREAIKVLRQERFSAATAVKATPGARAKKAVPNGDDLLKELEGL